AEGPAESEPSVDSLFQAISLLAHDLAGEGTAWAVVESKVSAAMDQLRATVEARVGAAEASITALVDPLVQAMSGIGGGSIGDVAGLASSGAAVVKLVAGAMRALAPDHVGTTLGRFFDVLEKDLGLDHATVAAAFDGSLDRIVSGLQRGVGDGVALGAAIQQLRRAGA